MALPAVRPKLLPLREARLGGKQARAAVVITVMFCSARRFFYCCYDDPDARQVTKALQPQPQRQMRCDDWATLRGEVRAEPRENWIKKRQQKERTRTTCSSW